MDLNEYIKNAVVTESPHLVALKRLNDSPKLVRLLHSAMGMETEVGEYMDQLKKHIFYGKKLDIVNLKEEIGDLFWYIAISAHCLDINLEEVLDTNIAKLKERYPDRFSEINALDRSLDKEREILEI